MTQVPKRLLLGPQRPQQNLGSCFAASGFPPGPVAVISAGLQEAETDINHIESAINRPLVGLDLYHRAEQFLVKGSPLYDDYRARQDRLVELQALYRRRLRRLATASRDMHRAPGDAGLLVPEQRHAMAQLRALDAHHLARTEGMQAEFEASSDYQTYEPLLAHRAAIADMVAGCACVLITGGNVIILINRMRLFGLGPLLRDKPIAAWSAGAMVLANRIVLYHDSTPQGRRDPEILGAGLGLLPGFVFLPDAKRRLRHTDRLRTSLFGRRFSTDTCLTLDNGAALEFDGQQLIAATGTRRIARSGRLEKVRV